MQTGTMSAEDFITGNRPWSRIVRWPADASQGAKGRQGWSLSTGVELTTREQTADKIVQIELRNINSRGVTSGSLVLNIPVSAAAELGEALQYLAAGPLGRLAIEAGKAPAPETTTVETKETT